MDERLDNLKSKIQWLTEDILESSQGLYANRHFPSFMKELNDVIKEGKIVSFCDVLQLEEIRRELELAKLNFKANSKNYELATRTLSLLSSILTDVDKKKAEEQHKFAIDNYDKYYKELLRESQKFKASRTAEINKDIWGKMLQEEENILENAEDDFCVEKALLSMSRANKLCINKTAEEDCFLNHLDSDNFITAFYYSLRLNILLSETFPDTLKPQFEAWLKGEDYKNPEPALAQEEEKEQAQEGTQIEVKAVKRKGGRSPELLFKDAEETEKMKKIFLEYIQSELEITLEDLRKMEFDSKRNSKLNTAIVKWLKQMQTENIFDIYRGIPKRAAYRFLLECLKPYGLTINADEKIYGNKLSEWLK